MRSRSHCADASKKILAVTLGVDCLNLWTFGRAEGYFYGGEIAVDPEAEQQKEQFGLPVADDDMWESPSLPRQRLKLFPDPVPIRIPSPILGLVNFFRSLTCTRMEFTFATSNGPSGAPV